MKYYYLFLSVLVLTNSIGVKQFQTPSQVINQQFKSQGWGQIIMSMTQIAQASGKSLKELDDAIEAVVVNILFCQIKNISENVHSQEFTYKQKSAAFNQQVQKLEISIDDSITYRARNLALIDDVFNNYIETINKRLESLEQNMKQSWKQRDYLTEIRKRENTQFLSKFNEATHHLQMIDLCILLIERMLETGEWIQIDRIKMTTQALFTHLGLVEKMESVYEAVQNMAPSEKSIIKGVLQLFNELRNAVLNNQNSDIAYENEQQQQYDNDIKQLEREALEFKRQIAENLYQLSVTQEKISFTKEALENRQNDQNFDQGQLELIKNGIQVDDKYDQLIRDQYTNELVACQKAQALIRQPDFQSRMDNLIQ